MKSFFEQCRAIVSRGVLTAAYVLIFAMFLSSLAAGQETKSSPANVRKTRPKIGLVLSGGGVLRETFSAPAYIGGKLYLGGWYEGGTAFEIFDAAKYRQSVTGGALLQTRIGPIFVGGSFAKGGRRKLYFSLGRFF